MSNRAFNWTCAILAIAIVMLGLKIIRDLGTIVRNDARACRDKGGEPVLMPRSYETLCLAKGALIK